MVQPQLGFLVELHWRLVPKYWSLSLDLDLLWARRATIGLLGASVSNLAPEENLLVLAVHGAKHQWLRLDWVCCVAELLRAHPELDWSRALENARACASERIMLLGVALARALVAAPVPASLAALIEDDQAIAPLVAEVRARMFAPPERELDPFAHAS